MHTIVCHRYIKQAKFSYINVCYGNSKLWTKMCGGESCLISTQNSLVVETDERRIQEIIWDLIQLVTRYIYIHIDLHQQDPELGHSLFNSAWWCCCVKHVTHRLDRWRHNLRYPLVIDVTFDNVHQRSCISFSNDDVTSPELNHVHRVDNFTDLWSLEFLHELVVLDGLVDKFISSVYSATYSYSIRVPWTKHTASLEASCLSQFHY